MASITSSLLAAAEPPHLFGATFVPPASGSTTPGIQFNWNDGTNGNQTTPVIPLPPTSSYASPEITQTYDASTSQLTLWNSANHAADIIQFAAGSTNRTLDTTDIANIQSLYGSASTQNAHGTGHAARTTAAFMASLPTTTPAHLALVGSMHH